MAETPGNAPSDAQPAEKFGTFLGVFTPSVLTILGLIMYLRFGWVVGNVGLGLTILIVLMSSSITFITALSASSVSTNMTVGVGGEYFMISRSLGLELGGAIGIPLFLCRTLSITFYSFGLAESILVFWPDTWGVMPAHMGQYLTAGIIVAITAVSGKSAAVTLKLQVPIMIAVGLSIVALAIGGLSGETQAPEMTASYRTAPEGFWYVLAVFFPAVTGFTAGIGMSGDLRDPRRSIPRGTLLAVGAGTLIYLLIPIILAVTTKVSAEELAGPRIIWVDIAILGGWLVFPGVWGAILSSAFGSVLGGPRVLQALASDGLAPRFMARLSKTGQPTIATWISGAIALSAVALGGLNNVAQFVTVLFLTLYVTVNLASAIEDLVGDPSYRPTIKVPWYVSLVGAVGAVSIMFLINPLACVAAVSLELALYFFLRHRALQKQWGDVWAGLWVALARFALLRLRKQDRNPRNWRPHILLFAGETGKRMALVRLASWFNQGRGVVTACQVVVGDLDDDDHDAHNKRTKMEKDLDEEGLVAFAEVDVVPEFESGVIGVAQANGIAGLQSNTVMFGWPRRLERLASQLRIMRAVAKVGKNTIIARINWAHEPGQRKRFDLWWGGLQNNGDLMLLFAYLLSQDPGWRDVTIRIRSIVRTEEERATQLQALSEMTPEVRIHAETDVIIKPDDKTIAEVMHEHSRNADVVFLGLMEPEPGQEAEYAARLDALAEGFNTTIFVRNASEFAGRLI